MRESTQKRLFFAALTVLFVVVLALALRREPEPPPRSDYYTGPIGSKTRPGYLVTLDGKVIPPPPGWRPKVPVKHRPDDL